MRGAAAREDFSFERCARERVLGKDLLAERPGVAIRGVSVPGLKPGSNLLPDQPQRQKRRRAAPPWQAPPNAPRGIGSCPFRQASLLSLGSYHRAERTVCVRRPAGPGGSPGSPGPKPGSGRGTPARIAARTALASLSGREGPHPSTPDADVVVTVLRFVPVTVRRARVTRMVVPGTALGVSALFPLVHFLQKFSRAATPLVRKGKKAKRAKGN
jgi:hypothetical protein